MNIDRLYGCLVFPPIHKCPSYDKADHILTLTKRTLFLKDSVIHIGKSSKYKLPEAFSIVIERWFGHYGSPISYAKLYSRRVREASKLCTELSRDMVWQVEVPQVKHKGYGTIIHDKLEFPYWIVALANGEDLERIMTKGHISSTEELGSIYRTTAMYLGVLHSKGQNLSISIPLRFYYRRRLQALEIALRHMKKSELIRQLHDVLDTSVNIVKSFRENVAAYISPEETMVINHGDFRANNLVVDLNRHVISVIDFDQGLFGGDSLVDLDGLKLLPGSRDPHLPKEMIQSILLDYFDKLKDKKYSKAFNGDSILNSNEVISGRLTLILVDKLTSFLVYAFLRGFYSGNVQDDASFTPQQRINFVVGEIEKITRQ